MTWGCGRAQAELLLVTNAAGSTTAGGLLGYWVFCCFFFFFFPSSLMNEPEKIISFCCARSISLWMVFCLNIFSAF